MRPGPSSGCPARVPCGTAAPAWGRERARHRRHSTRSSSTRTPSATRTCANFPGAAAHPRQGRRLLVLQRPRAVQPVLPRRRLRVRQVRTRFHRLDCDFVPLQARPIRARRRQARGDGVRRRYWRFDAYHLPLASHKPCELSQLFRFRAFSDAANAPKPSLRLDRLLLRRLALRIIIGQRPGPRLRHDLPPALVVARLRLLAELLAGAP